MSNLSSVSNTGMCEGRATPHKEKKKKESKKNREIQNVERQAWPSLIRASFGGVSAFACSSTRSSASLSMSRAGDENHNIYDRKSVMLMDLYFPIIFRDDRGHLVSIGA